MDHPVTHGIRSLMVETIPRVREYYQGGYQSARSPGSARSLVFSCDLYVVRGIAVIKLCTYDPFPHVIWLGYAVVDAKEGFKRLIFPPRP